MESRGVQGIPKLLKAIPGVWIGDVLLNPVEMGLGDDFRTPGYSYVCNTRSQQVIADVRKAIPSLFIQNTLPATLLDATIKQ